jgi:hypothetical protein
MNYVFVDIETLPAIQWAADPERLLAYVTSRVPATHKKPETVKAWIEENSERVLLDTAMDWRHGNLLCIGFAINDEPVQVSYAANPLAPNAIESMFDQLQQALPERATWVGHNILGFDLRWLKYTAIRINHPIAGMIPFEKWTKRVVDTMASWAGPDPRDRASLGDICSYLGLGAKGEGLHGADVYAAWVRGEHERIQKYCAQDVELVRALHWRLLAA